ncbi:MAG: 3'-5' exonuclease [Acidimicrobiales bacterium]
MPGRFSIGRVVVRQYGTAEEEAAAVANKITSLIQSGVAPQEIIVLAQRRAFATPIFHRLREQNIPAKSYYAESALDSTEAQERFAILKLFLNNEDRVALRWLLGCGHNDWLTRPYRRLLERVRQHGASPWATLCELASGTISIPYTNPLLERFEEIRNELTALAEAADLDQFVELWLPQMQQTELLAEALVSCREKANTIRELYDALHDAISQPDVPLEIAEVRVMSLHKSKGLSAPYVFVVGCIEGLLPTKPGTDLTHEERDAKLQEDRRLFYVGITRVKADLPDKVGYLALTYPQTMLAADAFKSQIAPVSVTRGIAYLQPSRFFSEMMPHVPTAQYNAAL